MTHQSCRLQQNYSPVIKHNYTNFFFEKAIKNTLYYDSCVCLFSLATFNHKMFTACNVHVLINRHVKKN